MKNNEMTVLKELYNTELLLLMFERDERAARIERGLFDLLCGIFGLRETAELWKMVQEAGSLQTSRDESFLKTAPNLKENPSAIWKMEMLLAMKIQQTLPFNPAVIAEKVIAYAEQGQRHACKLFACLSWLGIILPENRSAAVETWAALSMDGDYEAVRALVYAHEQLGHGKEADKWRGILHILNAEQAAFSSVAIPSRYREFAREQVDMANLILFMRQKNACEDKPLNRAMLRYLLESPEPYEKKMWRLSVPTDFSEVLLEAGQNEDRKFGF
jgi:hypothetical protein